MDLIPKPDQVIAAAGNIAHKLLYGGLADLRPMPRTLIDEAGLRQVYHYLPAAGVPAEGDPVLLVTPLAAPAICFDLRRGGSLVEHLVQRGRRTYLVEYGEVAFRDRSIGLEHWVDEVLPEAIRTASRHAGGRPVHLVGWSLGGLFSLLVAADRDDLPIASVTALGTPVDVSLVPLMAPLRPLLQLTAGRGAITRAYQAMGGVPKPLVGWGFQLASLEKVLTKPLAIVTNLDDGEFLAQLEAVDRFSAGMIAYPGRSFGQVYHRFVKGNELAGGELSLGDRTISLSRVRVPVLVLAGSTDGIAPMGSVKAVVPMLSGSPEVRFEIVPGGHLGMLAGRAARTATWPVLDEWVREWTTGTPVVDPEAAPKPDQKPGRRTPAKKAARKSPAKRAAAAAKPTPTRKAAAATKAPPAKTAAKPLTKRPARKTTTTSTTKPTPATKATATKPVSKKPATKAPAKKTAKKATKKATPARTTPAKKTVATKAPAKKTTRRSAASQEAIGANPKRRYGSAGSRALGR